MVDTSPLYHGEPSSLRLGITVTEIGTFTSLVPHLKRLDMPPSKEETGELQSRAHALNADCDWPFLAW
jgi:hypothetical protein